MAKKRYYSSNMHFSEPYAGIDARKRMEMEDSGMIHEDHKAVANLPQNVMYHPWPANPSYANYNLNDTIKVIDVQINDDEHGRSWKKDKYPEKY